MIFEEEKQELLRELRGEVVAAPVAFPIWDERQEMERAARIDRLGNEFVQAVTEERSRVIRKLAREYVAQEFGGLKIDGLTI